MVSDSTPRIGDIGPEVDPVDALPKVIALTSFTIPFNVTGQPAISLPVHWGEDGLPIGVQLVAAYGREDVLLQVAPAGGGVPVERAAPQHRRLLSR